MVSSHIIFFAVNIIFYIFFTFNNSWSDFIPHSFSSISIQCRSRHKKVQIWLIHSLHNTDLVTSRIINEKIIKQCEQRLYYFLLYILEACQPTCYHILIYLLYWSLIDLLIHLFLCFSYCWNNFNIQREYFKTLLNTLFILFIQNLFKSFF